MAEGRGGAFVRVDLTGSGYTVELEEAVRADPSQRMAVSGRRLLRAPRPA